MTHDEAVKRIRIYIGGREDGSGRSDVSTTLISSMLNERMKMLCVPFRFPQHETFGDIETVDGVDAIVLPANVYAIDSIVDTENDYPLDLVEFENYRLESKYATGLPRAVSFYGGNIYISPTPNGVYTLRWYGFSLPANVTGATQLPVPEDWHPMVCKYTAADILFMKKQFESALGLKNEALGDLSTRVEARTYQRLRGSGQISVARPSVSRRRRFRD